MITSPLETRSAQPKIATETRVLLRGVSWNTYDQLTEERAGTIPRMTYDQGTLEFLTPGKLHESLAGLIDRMIFAYCQFADIELLSAASTTFKRTDLTRGFEADRSYYFQNEHLIRAKDRIDLAIDPPPELVIEVEITSSAIAKMDLFAAMGVQEVWRHDGSDLLIRRLVDGQYVDSEDSVCLPGISIPLINRMLDRRGEFGENAFVREFHRQLESDSDPE